MEYKLRDLYKVSNGLSKGGAFFGSGFPFISFSTVFNNFFIPEEINDFVQSTLKEQATHSIKKGDILITRTSETIDELGMSCVALKDYPTATFNGFCKRLRPLTDKVYPHFVGYYMRTPYFRSNFTKVASLITRASLRNEDLLRFSVELPPVDKQKKIAEILYSYDSLIKNNNKRIKLLEQMAENLYKEWFVRFRFPGCENVEFIDGFPKEWKICRIDQLSKIKAGGDAPNDSTKEKTDECSIPIYSNGIENEGLYGYTSKAKITKPSISISSRGTVGYTCLRRVSYTPIVRLICIIPHEEKLVNWLFYYFKRTIVIANGTSQQQITIPMMSREKVLLPTNDLIQKFYEYSTCYLDEIDSLKAQNSNLEKQRDMLLPRLMSGKLEV